MLVLLVRQSESRAESACAYHVFFLQEYMVGRRVGARCPTLDAIFKAKLVTLDRKMHWAGLNAVPESEFPFNVARPVTPVNPAVHVAPADHNAEVNPAGHGVPAGHNALVKLAGEGMCLIRISVSI